MIHLKPGHGLDERGYIVSDVSEGNIDNIYKPCIRDSIENLKSLFPHQLHSVYLYGSVARGDAIARKSDLDLIGMFSGELNPNQLYELKKLSAVLSQKYQNLVREVGIAVAYYDYTMDPANYAENAFLKELSLCIYGEDLSARFGPYKLTPEIAIRFNGDIGEVMNRTLNRIQTASNQEFKSMTQNFSRKLIRTYYSMVMVRSQIWTTRLSEQTEVFIYHFREKETVINTLLDWIEEPPNDREIVYKLFKREGEWAYTNFTREAKITFGDGES